MPQKTNMGTAPTLETFGLKAALLLKSSSHSASTWFLQQTKLAQENSPMFSQGELAKEAESFKSFWQRECKQLLWLKEGTFLTHIAPMIDPGRKARISSVINQSFLLVWESVEWTLSQTYPRWREFLEPWGTLRREEEWLQVDPSAESSERFISPFQWGLCIQT